MKTVIHIKKDKKNKLLSILPFADSKDLLELAQDVIDGNSEIDLEDILPFMDEEDVDELITTMLNDHHDYKYDTEKILPFASDETADKLFLNEAKKGKINVKILPFVSEKCLKNFTENYADRLSNDSDIECLFPFMESEDICSLIKSAVKSKKPFNVVSALQFLDEEDADKIIVSVFESETNPYGLKFEDVIPFASEETIDKLFEQNWKNGEFREKALPFVSDKALHVFVVNYCNDPSDDVDIDDLYPYLDEKDISMLIACYIKRRKKTER